MDNMKIFGIMAFLAFGGAVAAVLAKLWRRIEKALGMGPTMVFRAQERHVIDDPSVMLDGKVFGRVMDRLSTMERIIPIPEELKDISESFIRGQEDKNRARYIVNTAWAHASGRMSKLVDGFFAASTQAVEPKAKQLEGWISELSDFRGQNNIPNHAAQLDVFYHSFPPQAGEYVLGWADMVVWTSHRIVLLTPGAEPAIKATIPLEDVTAYLSSDSTWLKSDTVASLPG